MCGRINVHDHKGVQELLDSLGIKLSPERFESRYNAAPGSNILTAFDNDGPELATMEWGIMPSWAKRGTSSGPFINARSETIWEKPSFRHLIKSRRSVIPVNGFYEWKREGTTKTPYYIRPEKACAFALAGVYQITSDGALQCCVVTTSANDVMRPIHSRMPVILAPGAMKDWIASDNRGLVDSLMSSAPNEWLQTIRVSSYVNNPRHEGRQCIEPEGV